MAGAGTKPGWATGIVRAFVVALCMWGIVSCCSGCSSSRGESATIASSAAFVASSQEELYEYLQQADGLIGQAIALMDDGFAAYEAGAGDRRQDCFDGLQRLECMTGSDYIVSAPCDAANCAYQLSICVQAASTACANLGGAMSSSSSDSVLRGRYVEWAEQSRAEAMEAYGAYLVAAEPLRG